MLIINIFHFVTLSKIWYKCHDIIMAGGGYMFHLMIIDNKKGYGYCKETPIMVKDYDGLKKYLNNLSIDKKLIKNESFRIFAKEYNDFIYDKKEKKLYITYYIYVQVSDDPIVIKRYQLYFMLFHSFNHIVAPLGFCAK